MKKAIEHIKNRILARIILIIPVFVIITIVQKLWTSLNSAGSLVSEKVGLKALLGTHSVTLATTLMLVILFYVLGWLVKFSLLNRFRDWIENSLLQYIPGYLSYKAKMQEKLLPKKDARQPVLVDYGSYQRPGLLIEIRSEDAIIFFPNVPDSNNGQTHVVKVQKELHLTSDATTLLKKPAGLRQKFTTLLIVEKNMPMAFKIYTTKIPDRINRLWFAGLFLLTAPVLQAQQPATGAGTQPDSLAIVQYKISQEENQRKIDSLVALKLQEQLSKLDSGSERARQLEEELRKMKTADSARKQAQLEHIRKLKQHAGSFPVAPFGDTLFYIHLKLGSNAPQQRADNINKRIIKLYEDAFFSPDSLRIAKSDWGYEVKYKRGEALLTVTEPDAIWYETDAQKLSATYLQAIKTAVLSEKKENNLINWVKRLGLAILILGGAFLMVKVIQRLFGLLAVRIKRNRKKLFHGIHFGKIQIITPAYQGALAIRILGALKIFSIILGIYLSLPLLFNVFPGTEEITQTLLGWIISPARQLIRSIVHFLPNLFTLVVIFLFTRFLINGIGFLANQVEKGQMNLAGFHQDFARPTFNIVRFILYAFMLVVMFPYLPGSDSPAFQGVSVFLGVLLSLGSSSAINNIIAGLVITYMRPFKPGDRIKIGDITGDVIEKTMLVIKLKTIKNEEITVPNSTVLSSNTINYSSMAKSQGLVLHTTVTIGYDVPWRKMHEALLKAAHRTRAVLPAPAPFVWQTSLDDFYVSYQLNVFTNEAANQGANYSELHQHIQDCCREAGIEIMSPHYRANRDGSNSTIPSE